MSYTVVSEFSPHAWGWTYPKGAFDFAPVVFPTRVGVDRSIGER